MMPRGNALTEPARIGLIVILCVVCYWKMFGHYYYLDDTNAVFAGYLLSHDVSKIFSYDFQYIYMSPLRRYAVALSYLPNYLLSGSDPWSYYLTSLLLHIGNALLAYFIVRKLSARHNLSLLVATLYAVSLNKADAVMYMANRPTPMGSFFILLTLFLYLKLVLDGFRWLMFIGCSLSFVAALGSYENALLVPLLFLAVAAIFFNREQLRSMAALLPGTLFALTVAFLAVYLHLGTSATGGSVITETSLAGKGYHIFRNILAVFPSFVIPPAFLQSPTEPQHNATVYFGWIECLALFLLAAVAAVNLRLKERLIWFGMTFFFIASILTAVPRWEYYPLPFEGDMRWSVGKYSYLASFGVYVMSGTLLYRLYLYLIGTPLRRTFVRGASAVTLAGIILTNISWIYKREKDWDGLESLVRQQTDAVQALNLHVDRDTTIYLAGFILYHSHSRSLLRVLYDNPELRVLDVRDYVPGEGTGKSLFLIADGTSVKAYKAGY